MSIYRILAIDGGGVRGAFASKLIERLQVETHFLDHTHLVAGTSTGGIIALALAAGRTPAEITRLYQQNARAIFSAPLWRQAQFGIVWSRYGNDGLKAALSPLLGDLKLGDLTR